MACGGEAGRQAKSKNWLQERKLAASPFRFRPRFDSQSASREGVDIGRISFIDTLRWLISAAPGESMPPLLINPLRPDRHEPRAIKRRAKQYDLMNRPRNELRKRLKQRALAA